MQFESQKVKGLNNRVQMDFLEQENQRLRGELKAALEEVQSLREENM